MSKARKVWTRPDNPGHSRPSPQGCYVDPAIQIPLEDESLPHPGDGRDWEDARGAGWIPVEIVSVPRRHYERSPLVVPVQHSERGIYWTPVDNLRERQPEHEHKPWCERNKRDATMPDHGCWCYTMKDPRSGEERRDGERREHTSAGDMAGGRRQAWARGMAVVEIRHRRSGKDRRSS